MSTKATFEIFHSKDESVHYCVANDGNPLFVAALFYNMVVIGQASVKVIDIGPYKGGLYLKSPDGTHAENFLRGNGVISFADTKMGAYGAYSYLLKINGDLTINDYEKGETKTVKLWDFINTHKAELLTRYGINQSIVTYRHYPDCGYTALYTLEQCLVLSEFYANQVEHFPKCAHSYLNEGELYLTLYKAGQDEYYELTHGLSENEDSANDTDEEIKNLIDNIIDINSRK